MRKLSLSFAFACLYLIFSGCSSTIKVELWSKRHPDAALAIGVYATSHPDEASLLFKLDCSNRREFKNQISYALKHPTISEPTPNPIYGARGQSVYIIDGQIQYYGFISWCNKYPKAAKSLRHHAKALCKAGTGILENYKMK